MKKIYSIVALALVAASCSSLMEKDINPVNPAVVQFTSNIGAFTTKATADGFETGDQVGIIAMDPINVDNVLYTFSGNTLTSSTPIHWLENQQESTYFIAYYPYDEEMSIYTEYKYELKVATDQRSHEAYSRSDFLVAQTRAMPGEKVDLEFEHFMSRVDISLPESLVSDVTSVALSGVYTSMVDGEPVNEAAVTAAELTDASGEKFYSAIIVPQETAPSLVITKTDGSVLSYPVDKIVNFEHGKRYYAKLSIKDDGSLEAEFVFRIFDWLQGDWVWFDGYVPRWSVIGSFTDWNWDYEMENLGDGIYQVTLWVPEESEFKFRLNGSWDNNLGCAWSESETEFRSKVELGQTVNLVQGGPNLYYPEGGQIKIILDVNNKTALIKEYMDFYVEMLAGGEWSRHSMSDVTGVYTRKELYLPANSQINLVDQNGMLYMSPEHDSVYDNCQVKILPLGVPVQLIKSNSEGCMLYTEKGFFADLVFDSANYTLTVTESENQTFDFDKFSNLPNGAEVSLAGQTVYAVAEEGYVVSTDGYRGIFIYCGAGNPLPSVGDVVDVTGKKQIFATHAELAEATFVKTGEAEIGDVYFRPFEGYNYGYSTPVSFKGQLYSVSSTAHEYMYVLTDNGILRSHYCLDSYLKYYGSKVNVTAWYSGDVGSFHYFTLVSIDGLEEGYHGAGTAEDPYDAVGAQLFTRSLQPGSESDGEVFIKGKVHNVVTPYSIKGETPGYGTFTVSNSGSPFYDFYFTAFQASFLENKPWVDGNSILNPDDEVVVCGHVWLGEDGSFSTMPGAAYLYSLNGATSEVPNPFQYTGEGTLDNPYTIADAIRIAEMTGETATEEYYYIRGRISDIREEYNSYYGNATFSMVDENGDGSALIAYRVYYFNNEKWEDGQNNVSYWDDVTVYSRIVNYKGTTPETSDGWLYSLNGQTAKTEPVTMGAWSVIGQIQGHNWDYDIPMYQCYDNGGYYALIYYREGESFKLRKDADWAENRGITGGGGVGSYGAVAGGDNIVLPGEGIYEVFYYPNEEYIYIAEYGNNDTWGITGTLEAMEWNADHMSNQATVNDNLCPVIVFNDVVYNQGEEFKIRFQHQWFFEYGGYGDVLVPGYTYATQAAGANMTIGESGTYTVYFNLYDQTVMVEQSSGENPQLPAISIPEIVELVKGGTSSSAVSFEGIIDYTLVTYVNGNYAYLQDNSGSILLYQKEHGLNTGDIFKGHIYGSGYSYNGLPEITSIGDQYTLEGNSGSVNPDNVTLERVYDYYDFFTSRLIRLEGVTVTASSGRNATIVQDGMQIALYAQDRSLTLPAVNSVGNLTAIVGIYGETKQLLIWEDGWFEKTGEVETPEDNSVWEKKALSNLSSGDEIVLVSVKDGAVYAMSNSGGTSSAPSAVQVTPENDTLTGPSADICWTVDVTDDGFVFYKDQSSWLYSTSTNNGNRVGTNENKFYTLCDEGYLVNVATSRYIGVYNNQDWRCYTSINNNIKDQEFYAFVKVSE